MSDRKDDRLLRLPEVEARVGLTRSTIYRLMAGELFPGSVQRSPGTVGWWESEIEEWLHSRPRTPGRTRR